MESMTLAELFEVRADLMEFAGMQFQYWLAMTFALIAATHVAGNSMSLKLKAGVGILYLSSTCLFVIIYLQTGSEFAIVTEYLEKNTEDVIQGGTIGVLRLGIWVLGTVGTLWFMFSKRSNEDA